METAPWKNTQGNPGLPWVIAIFCNGGFHQWKQCSAQVIIACSVETIFFPEILCWYILWKQCSAQGILAFSMEAGISSLKYGSSGLLSESFLFVWKQYYAQESVSGSIEAVFCTGKCCWKYGSSVLHREVLLAVYGWFTHLRIVHQTMVQYGWSTLRIVQDTDCPP